MFTSTSPRELFRPMMMRFCRTKYSMSRPSMRAMASPLSSGLHWTLEGLVGADFSERRVHASLSDVCEKADIATHSHSHAHAAIGMGTRTGATFTRHEMPQELAADADGGIVQPNVLCCSGERFHNSSIGTRPRCW
jgi:hypothetical protein